MQRISKTDFVNAIQHLTDSLGGKPKIKDVADYLNEQNKDIYFSTSNIAYYIKKYECDDVISKNDYIYLDITKESFVDVLNMVTQKLGRKPKLAEVAKEYKNDRVATQTIRSYMKKFGLEERFDYRPYKK